MLTVRLAKLPRKHSLMQVNDRSQARLGEHLLFRLRCSNGLSPSLLPWDLPSDLLGHVGATMFRFT